MIDGHVARQLIDLGQWLTVFQCIVVDIRRAREYMFEETLQGAAWRKVPKTGKRALQ